MPQRTKQSSTLNNAANSIKDKGLVIIRKISLEQAQSLLLEHVRPLDKFNHIALFKAAGRILYEDIYARINQPPFDRSPLDGYALRHTDIANASLENPVGLSVSQQILAGDFPQKPLTPGICARIATGAPVPTGATTVVRQEDTELSGEKVCFSKPQAEYENYCFKGEDVREGQFLFKRGTCLDAARIGILAGQGMEKVKVFRRPKVGILSTGSELSSFGIPLEPGKIYDSNQYMLAARAHILGGKPILGKSAEDNPRGIASKITALLEECDLIVTSGGVSVGQHDFMPKVGGLLGAEELFHGVAVKPGSPALALQKGGKLIICLSGNPFAAAATFELLAAIVIRALAGNHSPYPARAGGRLSGAFPKASAGRRFLRACIQGGKVTLPGHGHASGKLAAMAGCNCLIDIPAGSPPLRDNDPVKVILF